MKIIKIINRNWAVFSIKSSTEYPINVYSSLLSEMAFMSFKKENIFLRILLAGIISKLLKSISMFNTYSVFEGKINFNKGIWVTN